MNLHSCHLFFIRTAWSGKIQAREITTSSTPYWQEQTETTEVGSS